MPDLLDDGHPSPVEQDDATTVVDSVTRIVRAVIVLAIVELLLVASHIAACYATGRCVF